MTTPFVRPASDPSLADLLNQLKKDIMMSFNCHAIATVESFDSSTQTVRATLNYQRAQLVDQGHGIYTQIAQSYPVLLDVPVVCLSGGAWSLTFPITAGDQCIILFNDRDIDNWFSGQPVQPPATSRLHSFSDGIAIVGLQNANNKIASYDTTRAKLSHGETMVAVGATLVKIANNTTTLNTLINALINDIKALVSATAGITVTGVSTGLGVSGPPVNAATISAVSTALTTLASEFAGLLE